VCGLALLAVAGLAAQDLELRDDGGPYHLFNPTPASEMRDFVTDRPDFTEAAITVPAGHFQAEISFFDISRDSTGGTRTETDLIGNVNLKMGLLENVDIQFIFDAFTENRTTTAGVGTEVEGFSDLTTRLKINLWGNDGGSTAFALFPYVKIPTGTNLSNDEWEGGVILPFSMDFSDDVSFGAMLQVDLTHDANSGSHDVDWIHTMVVGLPGFMGVPVADPLGTYLEYVGIAGSGAGLDYQALFSGGFTWAMGDNTQWDVGFRAGLNEAAEDFGVFSGISFRF
jgi:hypothetical protein